MGDEKTRRPKEKHAGPPKSVDDEPLPKYSKEEEAPDSSRSTVVRMHLNEEWNHLATTLGCDPMDTNPSIRTAGLRAVVDELADEEGLSDEEKKKRRKPAVASPAIPRAPETPPKKT